MLSEELIYPIADRCLHKGKQESDDAARLAIISGAIKEALNLHEGQKHNTINVVISKTNQSTPYMAEIHVNGKWFKEMGPFQDPQIALQEVSKNDDLQVIMRPKHSNQNASDTDDFLVSEGRVIPTSIRVIKTERDAMTGINDYILSDGKVISCFQHELPAELDTYIRSLQPATK